MDAKFVMRSGGSVIEFGNISGEFVAVDGKYIVKGEDFTTIMFADDVSVIEYTSAPKRDPQLARPNAGTPYEDSVSTSRPWWRRLFI